jgi:tRNA(Phe) wybutosine-synthesizing methylase Tyw3
MPQKPLAEEMLEALRTATDAEDDAILDEMVKEGIIDEDGRVLKKIPEPPDWLLEASCDGRAPKAEAPTKPAKKAKRPRNRG